MNKDLKKALLLKLEVSFDQLVDIALRLEEADKESDVEVVGAKQNFNINKKSPINFKGPNPNKKGKQATSAAKTPNPNRGECYNCAAKDIMQIGARNLFIVVIAKVRVIFFLHVPNFKARRREN